MARTRSRLGRFVSAYRTCDQKCSDWECFCKKATVSHNGNQQSRTWIEMIFLNDKNRIKSHIYILK